MKTITNRTRRPLRVPLPGGKTLHLGIGKSGQISDHAVEAPAVKRLIEAGDIQLAGEGAETPGSDGGQRPVHEQTHGHRQPKVVMPKGNR